MFSELNITLIAIIALLWGSAVWLWRYRNRPEELNERLPLIQKYQKNRLHPLFGKRTDILGLAGWFFGVGLLVLGLLLVSK